MREDRIPCGLWNMVVPPMHAATAGFPQMLSTSRLLVPTKLAGACLCLLLAAVAFLLECHQLSDADLWLHLAAGQRIIEDGEVPREDSFGFARDRWVDVDWGSQLLLTLIDSVGGLEALTLVAAALAAAVVFVGLLARRPDWHVEVSILCWLPAVLLMTWRLGPRPETLSLLFLAAYLVILQRIDERPALAWILPPLQLLWVNTSSLFLLGPAVLLLYVMSLPASRLLGPARQAGPSGRQLAGVALAVVAVCLVNPYLFRVFPAAFEVLARLGVPGNFYKERVKPYYFEFLSVADLSRVGTPAAAGAAVHVRALYFLLLALPLSFLFPAAWRASVPESMEAGPAKTGPAKTRPVKTPPPLSAAVWISWLGAALALIVAAVTALYASPIYTWMIGGMLFLVGTGAAVKFLGRSRPAARLVFLGSLTLAAGLVCLHAILTGLRDSPFARIAPGLAQIALGLTVIFGSVSLYLALRQGANMFRVLATVAFAYLGWQAIRNISLFALVAGIVLSWNVGEWLARLRDERGRGEKAAVPSPRSRRVSQVAWGLRGALAAGLAAWGIAIASDPLFGFGEEPGLAHDAVRFAGQDGLPANAVVYDLQQAALFPFHNGAGHKTLMDGRLTLDRRRSFIAYTDVHRWLNTNDHRWHRGLGVLGNPTLVISHRGNERAQAAVLGHPAWRLIYYDALAAVFVPHGDGPEHADRERRYPTVNLVAYRWRTRAAPSTQVRPLAEMKDLHKLAVAVREIPGSSWKWRIPLLSAALDRAPAALDEQPLAAWTVLGTCHWDMMTDLKAKPARPGDAWDPARGLTWAQATYCFRQALLLNPDDRAASQLLAASFDFRDMSDAAQTVARKLAGRPAFDPVQPEDLAQSSPSDILGGLSELLKRSFPEACLDLYEKASRLHLLELDWELAERVAPVYLHLGRPAEARRLWQNAVRAPEALQLCRLADTYWVERDFQTALGLYTKAAARDAKLGEARWGLAMLLNQLGRAVPSRQACREGLHLQLTPPQRADLLGLQDMLARCPEQ